jgi:hypothetical protein
MKTAETRQVRKFPRLSQRDGENVHAEKSQKPGCKALMQALSRVDFECTALQMIPNKVVTNVDVLRLSITSVRSPFGCPYT